MLIQFLAEVFDFSAGRVNEIENRLDCSGLAGTISAYKSHNHALVYLKGNIVKGEFGIFLFSDRSRIKPCPYYSAFRL